MKRILFVCLGNICRSPLVEAVARQRFTRAGLDIDVASAGTGDYHIGEGADPRAVASAAGRDYDLSRHRARQIKASDYAGYDLVLAMDKSNYRVMSAHCDDRHAKRVALFLPFAGISEPAEVPDPYFGGTQGFEYVIDLAERGVDGLIARFAHGA